MSSRKIETYLMKRSSNCLKGFFYIEGKLKLQCLTILWKSRWVGGSLNLEILRGGGLKQFWKSRWEWGSKNRAFHRGGVDFFWNNPMLVSQTPLVSTVPFLFNNNKYILIWCIYKAQCPSLKCTESLVWVSERRLMVHVSGLKRVLKKAYIPVGLSWPVVVRRHCGLVVRG